MDNFQIETAQNVQIGHKVAGLGERILAFLIDGILILGYVVLVSFLLDQIQLTDRGWALIMIVGLPPFLYFLIWETFWNGQSPGKAAMDIRVVKMDGTRAGFSDYLVRWLLRIIDISLTSGSVAVVCILVNGKGQRLGDLAAGTTVISEKLPTNLSRSLWVEIPEDYIPQYPQVRLLSDAQMQKIKNLYQEGLKFSNYKLIGKLSKKVAEMIAVEPKEVPSEFLVRVIKDYSYYTQR